MLRAHRGRRHAALAARKRRRRRVLRPAAVTAAAAAPPAPFDAARPDEGLVVDAVAPHQRSGTMAVFVAVALPIALLHLHDRLRDAVVGVELRLGSHTFRQE
eukprot:2767695-Pleurochrysis_carterae.AAC.2